MVMTYKATFLEYLNPNNEQLRVSYGENDNNIFVTPRRMQQPKVNHVDAAKMKKKVTGVASINSVQTASD